MTISRRLCFSLFILLEYVIQSLCYLTRSEFTLTTNDYKESNFKTIADLCSKCISSPFFP